VAQPTSGSPGGTAAYTLAIRQIQQRLHRDLPLTTVWGFGDGPTGATYPGPTIEAGRDQPVTVTWVNDLRDGGVLRSTHYLPVDTCPHGADDASPRTVIHLHGGHVPAAFDGYPEATFLPGEQVTYQYPNTQLPATLWYHDHALGITRLNVYMGLAGFYLIRDAVETGLGLPAGEFEIPLVIQDRSFNADGSLQYPAAWQDHFFGDTILVNGKVWPYLEVKQGKYRFRLLNGSNSRTYTLALSSGKPFQVIGTDGGLLPAPVAVSTLTLTPAERADVVVDFASDPAGTEILLTNSAPAPYPGPPGEGVVPDVMKFVVLPEVGYTAALPTTLRPIEILAEADSVESRIFELRRFAESCSGQAWYINGLGWDDITEFPQLGTTEIWSFVNRSGVTHPMHMHLVMFQVLDEQAFEIQNGVVVPIGPRVPPPPEAAGWKDTVPVPPDEIVRVIARFEDYKGRFPYHCHILEHEDHEMMRQFQTVLCGDGELDPDEECDDGNLVAGDGCDATCQLEAIGVVPRKLVVVDKSSAGKAKTVFVAKDAGVTKGVGIEQADIEARLDVGCGNAEGAFLAPVGVFDGTAGWRVNAPTVAKYVNKDAPSGGGIKVTVVKPDKLIRLVAKNLGDGPAIDLFLPTCGDPMLKTNTGTVNTCYEVANDGISFRFGSTWPPGACSYKAIAGGLGRKLTCKSGGTGDASCAAAP
jgi:spore coat protein A